MAKSYSELAWKKYPYITFQARYLGIKEKENYFLNFIDDFVRIKPLDKILQGNKLTSQIISVPIGSICMAKKYDGIWKKIKIDEILQVTGYFFEPTSKLGMKRPYFSYAKVERNG